MKKIFFIVLLLVGIIASGLAQTTTFYPDFPQVLKVKSSEKMNVNILFQTDKNIYFNLPDKSEVYKLDEKEIEGLEGPPWKRLDSDFPGRDLKKYSNSRGAGLALLMLGLACHSYAGLLLSKEYDYTNMTAQELLDKSQSDRKTARTLFYVGGSLNLVGVITMMTSGSHLKNAAIKMSAVAYVK